jgi:nicotinate phosphoribosyltransferase
MFAPATFSLFIREYPKDRGGFDEFKIARSIEKGGQIDAYGVGTKMGVSADAPYLDIAYKLVQYDGRPVLKLSSGKKTLVGEKQVFRSEENGLISKDTIALRQENLPGEPLLQPVMREGARQHPQESLNDIRSRFQEEFEKLDGACKLLQKPSSFPVELSSGLQKEQKEVVQEVREKELGES